MNVAEDSKKHRSPRWLTPLAWTVMITFDICLVAVVCAQDAQDDEADVVAVFQIDGPEDAPQNELRFEAIDVFVDPGNEPLAAYQFELQSRTPGVEIVGIEGGEHPAFEVPPYYDPAAMNNNRVIIAAFNTGKDLPAGRSRVARIHVQLQGPGGKQYETKLTVSATVNGQQIPATASVSRSRA